MKKHKDQIALYLTGLADAKTECQTESALLRDKGFLEGFIEASERRLYAAPPSLAGSVMRRLPSSPAVAAHVPVLNRRLCAAACFCSAAAIMLFTLSGVGRQLMDTLATLPETFNTWIIFAQNLTGGI